MIEQVEFGRTGHLSSRVIFGAAAIGSVDQATADTLLPLLRDAGVNHIDTAAGYGDSELRLAPWLRDGREQFFVATKTSERTAAGARASLERSLERLGVDFVDLIQLHNLVEPEEREVALGPGGAVAALAEARAEGLVRFIGVTGHGTRIPAAHLDSLQHFDFDSVLFPYNYAMCAFPGYRDDVEALLSLCGERHVAVQTIKSVARRRWQEPRPAERRSWYEPLSDAEAITRAVHYVLGRPGLFLNSSSDFRLLHTILTAAAEPGEVPGDEEMARDVADHDIAALFDGASLERI